MQLLPQDPELVCCIAAFYQDNFQFDQGIKSAKECFSLRTKLAEKVFANHLIMRGLMSAGGYWEEFCATIEQQKLLLSALLKEQPTNLSESTTNGLFNTVFFFPYFEDSPKENTQLRSKISKLAQLNIEIYAQQYIEKYQNRPITQINKISADRRLKIGYISHCFRSHSVGWLARSLFQHHDRERFEIQGYFISYDHYTYNPMQDWYVNQVEKAHKLGLTSLEAAEKIYENEIDILVDLDSMTLTTTCEVMALKPAPIQVTWLGWDAS
ncbi:MAG: O-linked N-acetylglucosamine transferase, SPINDLY family protein, partial [Planktothrix sp.]